MIDIQSYIRKPRDSKRERDLARELRRLPEEERFSHIQEALADSHRIGLWLANTCLQHPKYFELLLEQALDIADANSIKYWLQVIVPKMGMRRVLTVLQRELSVKPLGVRKTIYWLPSLMPPDNDRLFPSFVELRKKVEV